MIHGCRPALCLPLRPRRPCLRTRSGIARQRNRLSLFRRSRGAARVQRATSISAEQQHESVAEPSVRPSRGFAAAGVGQHAASARAVDAGNGHPQPNRLRQRRRVSTWRGAATIHDPVSHASRRTPPAALRARRDTRGVFRRRRGFRGRHCAGVSRCAGHGVYPDDEFAAVDSQSLARVPVLQPLDSAGQGQCARPLRPRQGVLRAVARPGRHDVHLRVLEGRHAHTRGGAAQQDGPRVPQGAAPGRRDVRRRRLRLRRPPVPRMAQLRRARHGHQRTTEQVVELRESSRGRA